MADGVGDLPEINRHADCQATQFASFRLDCASVTAERGGVVPKPSIMLLASDSIEQHRSGTLQAARLAEAGVDRVSFGALNEIMQARVVDTLDRVWIRYAWGDYLICGGPAGTLRTTRLA